MRISDWSSDVCSSDLAGPAQPGHALGRGEAEDRGEGLVDADQRVGDVDDGNAVDRGFHGGEPALQLDMGTLQLGDVGAHADQAAAPGAALADQQDATVAQVLLEWPGRAGHALETLTHHLLDAVVALELAPPRSGPDQVGEGRSEERGVGNAGVRTGRSRWSAEL